MQGQGSDVLAFVMAGGEGSRLHPLTEHGCKPSVPFDGKHRLVDFVLSNLVNSGIASIYLLVQYKSQPLIEHVRQSWTTPGCMPRQFITVVPPQMNGGAGWFQGTADAVAQNLHLIEARSPDLVAVFGADHVYRMDVRQMIAAHVARDADATIATLPVPVAHSASLGIVETDGDLRVRGFLEKPQQVQPMPGRPTHALASMGNYIFSAAVLKEALRHAMRTGEKDFGHHVLPRLVRTHRLLAYDFTTNRVPGAADFEEPAYWRDVGTIDAYFDALQDTLGTRPKFRLTNPEWPIHSSAEQSPSTQIDGGVIRRSVIGSGCVVQHAQLDRALLQRVVTVEDDAQLEQCIVMARSQVGRGARLRRTIVDQDNHIPAGEVIGFDATRDRQRFKVSDNGVVVVPRAYFPGPATRTN